MAVLQEQHESLGRSKDFRGLPGQRQLNPEQSAVVFDFSDLCMPMLLQPLKTKKITFVSDGFDIQTTSLRRLNHLSAERIIGKNHGRLAWL